jgi:hypothetical protein
MGSVSLYDQMKNILDDVSEDVSDAVRVETNNAAKNTAKRLQNTSAKKTGEYARGWKSKRIDESTSVTYNATMPGLTHLLENGHVIRNKKGEYGRTSGDHKIADAETVGIQEYEDSVLRRI